MTGVIGRTERQSPRAARDGALAGANAAALEAPACGIDFIDRGMQAAAPAGDVAQLKSYIKNFDQTYSFGSGRINVGKELQAWLDPSDLPQGQSANLNQSQDEMMSAIRSSWGISGGDVVKGHLLNDNLGGSAMNYNLYPITRGANKDHLSYVENAVKEKVWNDEIGIYYNVKVNGKPDINQGRAAFDCTIKYWQPKKDQVGKNVIDPISIKSDLADARATGEAMDLVDPGNDPDRWGNPKKPSWVMKPKTRVKELTDDELEDRMDQD